MPDRTCSIECFKLTDMNQTIRRTRVNSKSFYGRIKFEFMFVRKSVEFIFIYLEFSQLQRRTFTQLNCCLEAGTITKKKTRQPTADHKKSYL